MAKAKTPKKISGRSGEKPDAPSHSVARQVRATPLNDDETDDDDELPPKPVRKADKTKVEVAVAPKVKVETAKERRKRLKGVKPTKVKATARGYYNDRLWEPGDVFDMVIDPTLEPPGWVVLAKKSKKKEEEEFEDEDEDTDEDETSDEETDDEDEEI